MEDPTSSLSKAEKAKIGIDIILVLLSCAGFWFGIYQYTHQTGNNLKEQFQRELWLQKKEIYTNICGVLGSIAAGSTSDSSFKAENKQFSALYYGGATLVYDKKVDSCIYEIKGTLLRDFRYNHPDDLNSLRDKVRELDSVCRQSLRNALDSL